MVAMLTEETLILIATLAATGLLVLGVLDLVWPTAPRVLDRPARAMPRPRTPFESLLVPRDMFGADEVKFTPKSHLGTNRAKLCQIQNQKWVCLTDYITD